MKTWKRILSLALCATLLLGVLGVSALAVDAKEYTELPYHSYTYLGDSISWGYGLDEGSDSHDPYNVGKRMAGSFTDIVGTVLEQNNGAAVHPAASSGARLCDFRILLERGMGFENPYDRENDWYGNRHPERTVRLREMGPEICGYLREADLVTVQLGINDLTAALVNALYATGLVDLNRLSEISDFSSALAYTRFALGNLAKSPDVLGNLTRTFNQEIAEIRANALEVLNHVTTLAPNADVLVIGYHKAVQSLRVVPGSDFSPIFDLANAALVSLNDYYSDIADQYANVYYVDAPDASVFYADGTHVLQILKDPGSFLQMVHPDAEGHAYIAERVLDALKELSVCHHEHTQTTVRKLPMGFGTRSITTVVCEDCGAVLQDGTLVTPAGSVNIPSLTIRNAMENIQRVVNTTLSRLTLGLLPVKNG